jgi:hypothetical protein
MKEMRIRGETGSLAFLFRKRSFRSVELVALVFGGPANFTVIVAVLDDWQPLKGDPKQGFGQEASLRHINWLEKRRHLENIHAARSCRDSLSGSKSTIGS